MLLKTTVLLRRPIPNTCDATTRHLLKVSNNLQSNVLHSHDYQTLKCVL